MRKVGLDLPINKKVEVAEVKVEKVEIKEATKTKKSK